jgi:ABC-type sugar transport system permease subunit/ABC-type glycerol-3-phosphate transport system substrate-binding protein
MLATTSKVRMARIFFAALLMLALSVSSRAGITLDIPVFAGGYGTAFYEETARQFEALRPGVKVNLYGDPRIHDKVRVRIIDGNYPDASNAPYVPWPILIRTGKVLDLKPWLDGPNWEGDARWRDTFLPGALDSWVVDDHVCGLPLTYSCWTIFYNKALFRAHGWGEPRTWDDFFALCEKIRAAGIAPLSLPGTRWLYPDAFLRAAYHNLAGDPGWRALNDLAPGARLDTRYERSAALLQRIMQHYVLPGWEGETHTGAELAFLQGRAAMTVSGSWLVDETKGKMPADFELGAMNFPVFPDGVADPTTIQTGADSFFVFATGDVQRERLTVDFLRFLTSRARAAAFVRLTDSPVAVRGVPGSAYSARMRDTVAMIAHAQAAFNMPQVMMQPPAVRQAMIGGSQLLTTGQITPRQFAERLEAAAATDRMHLADPNRVEMNHLFAGTALLGALAVVAGWAVWRTGRTKGWWLVAKLEPKKSAPAPGADQDSSLGRLRAPVALGFVGPAFLLYGSLVLLPGLVSFAWAFTRWDGIGPRAWAGLFNFKWLLFESDAFWFALKNNLYLVVVPTLVVVPVALLLATLIHRGVWGAKTFRVVLLFPNLLGGIAATLLWMSAYEPHGGLVNAGLVRLGRALHCDWLRSFADFPWLAQEHLYAALIPIYIWLSCGFNLILYLAAMEGIDPQLYEAAELDGAPAWRQFFTITLPLIWEMIAISAVFIVIGGLNAFEMIWLLTSQDPAAGVNTLGTLLVATMFKDFAIGRATAIAVVMFALVFAASATVLRLLKRETVEN